MREFDDSYFNYIASSGSEYPHSQEPIPHPTPRADTIVKRHLDDLIAQKQNRLHQAEQAMQTGSRLKRITGTIFSHRNNELKKEVIQLTTLLQTYRDGNPQPAIRYVSVDIAHEIAVALTTLELTSIFSPDNHSLEQLHTTTARRLLDLQTINPIQAKSLAKSFRRVNGKLDFGNLTE